MPLKKWHNKLSLECFTYTTLCDTNHYSQLQLIKTHTDYANN